jgi:Phosphoadenosine phosphosulfate reductase family
MSRNTNAVELGLVESLPRIQRLLVWWSAGATSTVAAKLALQTWRRKIETRVLYCETGSHHPDNLRFLKESEAWLDHPIEVMRNRNFNSVEHLIDKERYVNGPDGARCTKLLKILVRKETQRPGSDLQVFGFHAGEIDRAGDFKTAWPEVRLWCPLIERNMFHADCLAMLREAGIELPMLYRMGYKNNNCLGCVKGGMGYWNKVRKDFPDVFAMRAKQEREIGASCINGTFLDQLKPDAGRYEAEPDIACEGVCVQVLREVQACEV